jgi:hypothetical protein
MAAKKEEPLFTKLLNRVLKRKSPAYLLNAIAPLRAKDATLPAASRVAVNQRYHVSCTF